MLTLALITNVKMYWTMFIIFRLSLEYFDSNSDYYVDRTRPTTSVCRHKRCVVVDEEQEIYEATEHVAVDDVAPKYVLFGGGPEDKLVLTEYADHMACK